VIYGSVCSGMRWIGERFGVVDQILRERAA